MPRDTPATKARRPPPEGSRPKATRLTGVGPRVPRDAVLVALLNILAVVVYLVLVRGRVGPFIDNDEYIYGNLAQSIAAGDGDLWRGVAPGLRTIYPYVIAPAWGLADGQAGYRLVQTIGVLLMCSIVWPVWLASRQLVPGRWALLAPALAISGVWMAESARVMTEALAMPAVTWSLCLALVAIRQRSVGIMACALGFALLAGLARAQAGVVVVAITLGVTLDVLRRPRREWRAAAGAVRIELAVLWGLVIVGTVGAVGPGRSNLGDYGGVVGKGAPIGDIVRFAADHLTDLVLLAGVLPFLAVVALALQPKAWRSESTGPFLALFVGASVSFLIVGGWFGAAVSQRTIERYVEYVAPLVAVGLLPALRGAAWRAAIVASAALTLVALTLQDLSIRGNAAPSVHAFGERVLGWPGVPQGGSSASVALLVAVLGGVLSAGLWLRDRPGAISLGTRSLRYSTVVPVGLVVVAVAGVMIPSSWDWPEEHRVSANIRDTFGRMPDRVDRVVRGSGTIVVDTLPPTVPLWIEFFNKKLDRVAAGAPESADLGAGYGPICEYRLDASGRFAADECTAGKHAFVFMTAAGSVPTLRGGGAARTVGLPSVYVVDGPPRLLAMRQPICDETTGACRRASITTFAQRPGKLTLTFTGPQQPHQVLVGGRAYTIEPGAPMSITVPVPAGRHETAIQGDWPALLLGVPELDRVTLQEAGGAPVRLN